jgi:Leucine Rich repeat
MHCKWTLWDEFCEVRSLTHHRHCTQTLTTLTLWANQIGAEGGQSLGNALQKNMVRQLLCTSVSYPPSSLYTDTHNAESCGQYHRCRGSTGFRECIASQHGETTFTRFGHLFITFIAHRHSQRWILEATTLAIKEHSLWGMHCKRTRWDDFFELRSLIHHLHSMQILTTLDLRRNNIGAKGAHSLANALQVNTVRRLLWASISYPPPSWHADTHNAES